MSDFDLAVNYVLENEAGLEENKNDSGGITNFGISLRFLKSLSPDSLRKYGFSIETINADTIRELTLTKAKSLYKNEFWDNAPFQRIDNQKVTNFLFDMCINMNFSSAIKCIQRACWAVLARKDLPIADGIMGDNTIEIINHCNPSIIPPLRAERAAFHRMEVLKYPEKAEFLAGWLNRTYK